MYAVVSCTLCYTVIHVAWMCSELHEVGEIRRLLGGRRYPVCRPSTHDQAVSGTLRTEVEVCRRRHRRQHGASALLATLQRQ